MLTVTIKKLSVYLGVLIICVALFRFLKESEIAFINVNNTNNLASLPEEEFSSLATWLGEYSFSEYAPPNQNMFYSITVYCEGNNFFAQFSIDGFQRLERLLAKVSGDANSIEFEFLKYLPDNMLEIYEEGDVLLTLQKIDSKLITFWGKLQPLLLENRETGEYFWLISSTQVQ